MLARCSFHFFQRCNQGQRAQAGASVFYYFTGKVVDVAKHLTDKQKKKIIADRADGLSLRQLAAKYGTSTTTIHRVIGSDPETERKVTAKKE